MTDPLRDPRFPNRPQHPDYWRLAEIAMENDGDATEGGKSIADIIGVDEYSLLYLASNRIGNFVNVLRAGKPLTPDTLLSIYLDAFTTGKKFAERGGHQEGAQP